MQLNERPFLEIEQESHHRPALAAISLACLLLVLAKGAALLQYWQQTHHIFMDLANPPSLAAQLPGHALWSRWHRLGEQWLDERSDRLLLAGQLLLAGDKALPEPVIPPIAAPLCPEPPAAPMPVCPQTNLAQAAPDAAPVVAINLPTEPANALLAAETSPTEALATDITDPVAAGTESPAEERLDPPLIDLDRLPMPTDEELQAASAPIPLHPGDRLLLVGDSLMQGVAPHLITALKRNYKVESMDLSRHSTGLTYPAFFDWPATVKAAFELEQYRAVIVFLGANDPWDMNLQGKYVRFGSERWKEVYRARVQQIVRTAAAHNARLVWLGAPPMGREDLTGKEPLLNEIYAEEAARYPLFARFVATAPRLSPDGGSFAKFLELPERGSVMVRTDDGVHFTAQGQKLLARLALEQFTQGQGEPIARPAIQPTPEASSATHPTAAPGHTPVPSPASNGEPPPNQPPNPTISQR